MKSKVDICLATYNGTQFLKEFYESLREQTCKNWVLIARDDCSIDKTVDLLRQFSEENSNVRLLDDAEGNVGVIQNFSILLSKTTSNYVMLADQDDVWYPAKVEKSLDVIKDIERLPSGKIGPALVFTDLDVVDTNLKSIGPSFLHMQGLWKLRNPSFRQLLTQNVAPGCTMIVNRALLDLALPIPVDAAMHDWWLIQVASLFGRIGFIGDPTIAYRQHEGNLVGAKSSKMASKAADLFAGANKYHNRLRKAQCQANSLLLRYGGLISTTDREAVTAFSRLSSYPPVLRQMTAARHGLRKVGFIRNLGFYCLM